MIKKLFKDITGITAKELKIAQAELLKREQKEAAAIRRKETKAQKVKEEEAKLSPKEIANKRKEPWVDVTSFRVNQDNIKNGFFELDWNEYFIIALKKEGYGYDGDPDEEIVDRWYRDICIDIAAEIGVDMTDRGAGYINVTKLTGGKAEIK